MMWVELCATDIIINHDTENFEGFGDQLRAEEGSIIFYEFLFIFLSFCILIQSDCVLSHEASRRNAVFVADCLSGEGEEVL